MSVSVISGNLFDANTESLVNTVNTKGKMGRGIALEFKQRYPEMFNDYRSACKCGVVKVGKIWVWNTGALMYPQYILNFPTKDDWRNPSKLEWISSGLDDLRSHV